jgi:hypothetical protein
MEYFEGVTAYWENFSSNKLTLSKGNIKVENIKYLERIL